MVTIIDETNEWWYLKNLTLLISWLYIATWKFFWELLPMKWTIFVNGKKIISSPFFFARKQISISSIQKRSSLKPPSFLKIDFWKCYVPPLLLRSSSEKREKVERARDTPAATSAVADLSVYSQEGQVGPDTKHARQLISWRPFETSMLKTRSFARWTRLW